MLFSDRYSDMARATYQDTASTSAAPAAR